MAQISARWPGTTIVIRADSGFCRDDLMTWCEAKDVQYVPGLAGTSRLIVKLAPELRMARILFSRTCQPALVFADFAYRTRKSWSAKRRVIGKAEWTNGGANPRFVVRRLPRKHGWEKCRLRLRLRAASRATPLLVSDMFCRGLKIGYEQKCAILLADKPLEPSTPATIDVAIGRWATL